MGEAEKIVSDLSALNTISHTLMLLLQNLSAVHSYQRLRAVGRQNWEARCKPMLVISVSSRHLSPGDSAQKGFLFRERSSHFNSPPLLQI